MRIPDQSFSKLFNLSFGFFGVQIAYALQSANVSRIFSTLGAKETEIGFFWILPPLMGILVQPIVGSKSDKTWNRFGRRLPFLLLGALIAVPVICLLPNSGSFGFDSTMAIIFGVLFLILLDTSLNMAMQPFKMMVGDNVNEKQKTLAYSIQSFLCNAGNLAGFLLPFFFVAIGVSNTADKGVIPDALIYSFYVGAFILVICVIYTMIKVKEFPPDLYKQYHPSTDKNESEERGNIFKLLSNAPSQFWTVGLVQFFCWAAFLFMWNYTAGTIAHHVFDAPFEVDTIKNFFTGETISVLVNNKESIEYQDAGTWVGVLFAVQAVGSVIWAVFIPKFKKWKLVYALSLIIGGIGFVSISFMNNQYMLFISYFLIGFAWSAMLALPFTILTNALKGGRIGTYLGLFNGTICIPQILAGLLGGTILFMFSQEGQIVPEVNMLVVAGVLLFMGAISVCFIKENKQV